MKKFIKYIKVFAFLFITLIIIGIFSLNLHSKPPVRKIKIFLEVYATSPVLWESIELIKSSPDELKIFAFHRYPERAKKIDLEKINAIEIPFLKKEEGFYMFMSRRFINRIEKIISRYPDVPIEIYSNQNQVRHFLFPFLARVGLKRISHLHLYEDGACNIIGPEYDEHVNFRPNERLLQNILKTNFHPNMEYNQNWKFVFHKLLPTTYHWCYADKIKKDKNLKDFVDYIGAENIVQVDLETQKKRLNKREKDLLARFFGVDMNAYKKTDHKKTVVVTTGYLFGNQKKIQKEIKMFHLLEKLNDMRFYLKCHPSYSAREECKQIKEAFPNWIPIDESIPLEVFFLLDLEPDYVAGWLSSLYYLIPAEKILSVIRGPYFSRMLELGVLNINQVLHPTPLGKH